MRGHMHVFRRVRGESRGKTRPRRHEFGLGSTTCDRQVLTPAQAGVTGGSRKRTPAMPLPIN
jgi:hypothetical protein